MGGASIGRSHRRRVDTMERPMKLTYHEQLLEGLWARLGRYARGTVSQRTFLIYELTHVLSCKGVWMVLFLLALGRVPQVWADGWMYPESEAAHDAGVYQKGYDDGDDGPTEFDRAQKWEMDRQQRWNDLYDRAREREAEQLKIDALQNEVNELKARE
jgi:hypothetical protein